MRPWCMLSARVLGKSGSLMFKSFDPLLLLCAPGVVDQVYAVDLVLVHEEENLTRRRLSRNKSRPLNELTHNQAQIPFVRASPRASRDRPRPHSSSPDLPPFLPLSVPVRPHLHELAVHRRGHEVRHVPRVRLRVRPRVLRLCAEPGE